MRLVALDLERPYNERRLVPACRDARGAASRCGYGRTLAAVVASGFFFGEIPCGWVLTEIRGLDRNGRTVGCSEHEFDGDPSANIGPKPDCDQEQQRADAGA